MSQMVRVMVRMSAELHARVHDYAYGKGLSLSRFIADLMAERFEVPQPEAREMTAPPGVKARPDRTGDIRVSVLVTQALYVKVNVAALRLRKALSHMIIEMIEEYFERRDKAA